MQTRYHQLLFIVGLSLMVGCFDSSEDSSGTASSEASSATASPEIPNFPVCEGEIWEGDVTTEADFIAAGNCTEVTGDIFLKGLAGITAVDFPALEQVNGKINISELPNLKRISMPVLTAIMKSNRGYMDGLIIADNASLTKIDMPVLSQETVPADNVTIDVVIDNNAMLGSVTLPALTRGGVQIKNNDILTSMSMPALTFGGDMHIENNAVLTSVTVPALTRGDVTIENNAVLTNISMPMLLSGGHLTISKNDALRTVNMPVLTQVLILGVAKNLVLTTLAMPNLDIVFEEYLFFLDNPLLTSCDIGSYSEAYCP